jgi:hypothetical protein
MGLPFITGQCLAKRQKKQNNLFKYLKKEEAACNFTYAGGFFFYFKVTSTYTE